jgi:hypothetical protein
LNNFEEAVEEVVYSRLEALHFLCLHCKYYQPTTKSELLLNLSKSAPLMTMATSESPGVVGSCTRCLIEVV